MNVLVINCGSSSLKYQLINSDSEEVLAKGLCERIGIDGRLVYQKEGMDKEITEAPMPTHKEAIQMVLDALHNPKSGAVKDLSEIDAVGHRVVHGGEKFAKSVVLTEDICHLYCSSCKISSNFCSRFCCTCISSSSISLSQLYINLIQKTCADVIEHCFNSCC